MSSAILQFVGSAAAILVAGYVLTQCGDTIAKKTKLGGLFVGALLIAGATSLPELVVDVNAIRLGSPDLAVGDLMGSSLMNLMILAAFDLTRYSHGRMLSEKSAAHALAASLGIAMTALAAIFILLADRIETPVFFRVGPGSIMLILIYIVGFRLVTHSQAESRDPPAAKKQVNRLPFFGVLSLRTAVVGFAAAAAAICVAGPLLARSADAIAKETGLGGSFFGSTFVAFCTSLPEVASTFTAMRLRAFNLALGNLLGSNSLNMALLGVLDFTDEGSLFAAASPVHAYTGLCVIVVTAIVVLGQLYRVERKKPFLEPDGLLALTFVFAALTGLYFLKD